MFVQRALITLLPFCLGLCPDWAEWDPNQPVQNAREAMQQADDWLGVPQVRCLTEVSHEEIFQSALSHQVSGGWGGGGCEGITTKKSYFLIGHALSVLMLFEASGVTYLKCKHASTHVHTPVRQYRVVEKSRTVQGAEKNGCTVHVMEPSVSQ